MTYRDPDEEPLFSGDSSLESDPFEPSFDFSTERLLDLSDIKIDRLERAAKILAEYEREVANRNQTAADRATAVAAEENARSKRVMFERISERYIPFAVFLLFGFIPLVVGMNQILQYTDIRCGSEVGCYPLGWESGWRC
ncbi:hypothetical protein [Natronocalculus amylovorans]|uniref:Uncharacterized protein n=1 Tax=Natronocalculus amylovorans TaxID=2917812 RepID=A0AAE3FZU9_9EURY|nr:hypothetical protein [Natronocalculus amylovorans]MCL9818386.1 hypothetical protein [Natronocalculus amylovorans]